MLFHEIQKKIFIIEFDIFYTVYIYVCMYVFQKMYTYIIESEPLKINSIL